MRVQWIGLLLLAVGLVVAGCQKPPSASIKSPAPEGAKNGGSESKTSSTESPKPAETETNPSATQQTFTATLSGADEVPPVTSDAKGKAAFHVDRADNKVHYTLEVNDLKDVTMAHLHMAAAGDNGPVVVWLYPSTPPEKLVEGVTNGKLAEGTITASSLVGPLEGKSLSDLIAKMSSGDLYVNVHTKEHASGEIRGQLQQP